MNHILTYVQIGSAVFLVISIMLQQRGEGGLGAGIGGNAMEYSTKRGVERGIFYVTIAMAVIFLGTSIARLVLGA
jgi:protein translocase SecG subunit